ncbi:MAG: hypothetical protein JXB19_07035 [Bacteroidales bacterium]|nr:hypothetical protein [Bacteroidales bacterium]
MGENIVAIVFFVTGFAALFGIMYIFYTTRNRERLALIEKNADPSILKSEPKGTLKTFVIKLGLLFAGAGLGTLMGSILEQTTSLVHGAAYVSMIFLFAGAGLIASYFLSRKVQNEK